jgi:hypothetical protein
MSRVAGMGRKKKKQDDDDDDDASTKGTQSKGESGDRHPFSVFRGMRDIAKRRKQLRENSED